MARSRIKALPDIIYAIESHGKFRIYSSLASAKGVRTREARYDKNIKIWVTDIRQGTGWVEVTDGL